jgi:hypothetical protein
LFSTQQQLEARDRFNDDALREGADPGKASRNAKANVAVDAVVAFPKRQRQLKRVLQRLAPAQATEFEKTIKAAAVAAAKETMAASPRRWSRDAISRALNKVIAAAWRGVMGVAGNEGS